MKSVKYLLLAGLFMVFFSSCDKVKDAATITVDSNFKIEVPLESQSTSMKSVSTTVPFAGKASFKYSDDATLANFVSGINKMEIGSVACEALGMSGTNEINSLIFKVSVNGTSIYEYTLDKTLTSSANTFSLDNLTTLQEKLVTNKNEKFDISVSGTSNFVLSPLVNILKCTINSKVYYLPI